MYSHGTVNHSTVPMMPPPNFCPPPVYGNIPFQPPFAPPFYPPACHYYNSPAPCSSPNSKRDCSVMPPNFNPFSQPPPGYGPNGAHVSQNSCNGTAAPPYQPVHMANVNSPNFSGYSASNVPTKGNQYCRPPATVSPMNGGPKNYANRFSNHGNNRRNVEAKDSPYYCEACDRGFPSLGKFTEHKSQHVTCGQQGCTFSAHAKIVEKHFLMQHRTGLYNRIVKGDSPEEIQKWISERKKHFPTKEKIEVKEAQREEMKKRGERYAERKQKINQKNSNFKHGPNNRFNKNTPNRHGQFRSKTFGRRRNSSMNQTTDDNNQPQNRKRTPAIQEDEDCVLRNLLPFKGTAFYKRLENNAEDREYDEHTISDDNISILSGDEDIMFIECNRTTTNKNVISELEKSSETSQAEDEPEEGSLDKYFKTCDNSEETSEVFNNCDTPDKSIEKSCQAVSIDDSKILNDVPVSDSSAVDSSAAGKPALKTISSLALLQCYDSDDESGDNADNSAKKNNSENSSPVDKIESEKNDSKYDDAPEELPSKPVSGGNENSKSKQFSFDGIQSEKNDYSDDDAPEELPSKPVSSGNENSESGLSPLNKIESEKNDQSSDDSGPEECSSKCGINVNNNCQINSSSLKMIETTINNDSNGNVKPIACSSTHTDTVETDNCSTRKEEDVDDTKGCESKKRKRKRRRDSKNDVDCDEECSKQSIPEPKLPRAYHTRKRYRPPTLLEKLLFSEIKHERNVVLQCIRYTVDKNYFGLGESNKSS